MTTLIKKFASYLIFLLFLLFPLIHFSLFANNLSFCDYRNIDISKVNEYNFEKKYIKYIDKINYNVKNNINNFYVVNKYDDSSKKLSSHICNIYIKRYLSMNKKEYKDLKLYFVKIDDENSNNNNNDDDNNNHNNNFKYEIKVSENDFNKIKEYKENRDLELEEYRNKIYSIIKENIDIKNKTDIEIVNEINDYLCKNIKYEITNDSVISALYSGKGQCYHYSTIFMDICNSLGIECEFIESKDYSHCWNKIKIKNSLNNDNDDNNKIYYFDVTHNENYFEVGKNNKHFSWMEKYDGENVKKPLINNFY